MGNTHASQEKNELVLKNYPKTYKCDRCNEQGIDSELVLKNYTKPYKCDGCKQQGIGSRYRCEECCFDLHEDCIPTTCHDFFKNSTFKLFDKPPCERCCDACTKPINGSVYHCEEEGWDLHPCCLNLGRKLEIGGVKLRLCDKVSSTCNWCNERRLRDSPWNIKGWSYVSKCKNYHFHVYCVAEMALKLRENGVNINDNNCLALVNLELLIQRHKNRNGGRGNKYWRIVKPFLKTIPCILLGDPTITLTCLLVEYLLA